MFLEEQVRRLMLLGVASAGISIAAALLVPVVFHTCSKETGLLRRLLLGQRV